MSEDDDEQGPQPRSAGDEREDPRDAEDRELLTKWSAGDKRAGQALLRRHFDALRAFFRTKIDRGIEDLVQNTFLACVEGHKRIERASFRSYMFAIARRMLWREWQRRCQDEQVDPLVATVADVKLSVTEIVAKRREHRLLLLALQRIPLRDQELLELYVQGLSGKEIALVIEQPAKGIPNLKHRASQRLREQVAKLKADPEVMQSTLDDLELVFEKDDEDTRRALLHALIHGEVAAAGTVG
jgi:RNA polymerase sigma factor (sigma-70 family)